MASAASFLEELKAGKSISRSGYTSMRDSLYLDDKGNVTYAKYYGEGEWEYQTFTFEEIATWTDDGDWELE